ncbi:MAG: NAD(P)H-hydrate dehydratase [Rhodocyclales bacterium GWA2_65_19]|nr:MAG: NAD(P)H-hydrate dehydratase [Rhodocyclales bacterium GWA2_65_19]
MSAQPAVLTRKQVIAPFPQRPRDSHKGMFGSVAVIGGGAGMVGAALLAGRAALKLGAGLVHVGLQAENAPSVDLLQPELMLHPASDALKLSGIDVLTVGCGLGREPAAQKLLYDALRCDIALVLDADALNILALRPDLQNDLRKRKAATVLTPHPGEAARLLDCAIGKVQADRSAAVRQLAQQFAATVVLKGADSLCATRDGKLFVNRTGNPGMSAAGMGDVLTGMIAAFIAQGMGADDAVLLAVHLHGAAGDALAGQVASIGMSATEVTEWARWLLNQWL